jgi:hypothetical protein
MTARLTTQFICDILAHEMGLTDDQIWIYNQKQDIPPGTGLFVSVGQMGITVYGANRKTEGITEKLSQMLQETLSIEIYSNDTSALSSLPAVIGALGSTYSLQTQEKYGFKIGAIPTTINDTSFLEATAILYRLSLTIKVLRAYEAQKDIEYYGTFSESVKTET